MKVKRFKHEKTMAKFGYLPTCTYNNRGEAYQHFIRYLDINIDGNSRWHHNLTGGKIIHGVGMKSLKDHLRNFNGKK